MSLCSKLIFILSFFSLSGNLSADWRMIEDIPVGAYTKSLTSTGSMLFASTDGAGLFSSSNDGAKWTALNTGSANLMSAALFAHNGVVFAMSSECFRSTDNGVSWIAVSIRGNKRVSSFQHTLTALFAYVYDTGGFYKSMDNGKTWDSLAVGLRNGTLIAGATKLYYFGKDENFANKCAMSTDDGGTWTMIDAATLPSNAMSPAIVGNSILAGTSEGVVRSSDNGTTWNNSSEGMTSGLVNGLLVSGENVFATAYQKSIFKSENGGMSWTNIETGLGGGRAFLQLVEHNAKLFVLLQSGEIFRRPLSEVVSDVHSVSDVALCFDNAHCAPSPSSNSTTFHCTLQQNGLLSLRLIDLDGCTVSTPLLRYCSQGPVSEQLDLSSLASGLFYLRIELNSAQNLHALVLPIQVVR